MKTRKVPVMTTDEEAEAFIESDLSDLDFTQFKPATWEHAPKSARVNMRLPDLQLAARLDLGRVRVFRQRAAEVDQGAFRRRDLPLRREGAEGVALHRADAVVVGDGDNFLRLEIEYGRQRQRVVAETFFL